MTGVITTKTVHTGAEPIGTLIIGVTEYTSVPPPLQANLTLSVHILVRSSCCSLDVVLDASCPFAQQEGAAIVSPSSFSWPENVAVPPFPVLLTVQAVTQVCFLHFLRQYLSSEMLHTLRRPAVGELEWFLVLQCWGQCDGRSEPGHLDRARVPRSCV